MRRPLSYFASLGVALFMIGGFYLGGIGHFALIIAGFVLLPPIDIWRGVSRWPSVKALEKMTERMVRQFESAVVVAAWVNVGIIAWAVWAAGHYPLLWWQYLGLVISVGLSSGLMGIVVAHELIHRRDRGKQRLGWLLMALVGYAHFVVEHVRGHHIHVATPLDPASARRGESLYAFVPRSIIGGYASGWRLEAERLRRAGKPVFSRHNKILVWDLFTIATAIAIGLALGVESLLLFVAQGMLAVVILEMINYLEHYGLERARRDDGRYEHVRPVHSWNSSHVLTNVNLFNLGRHADHHKEASRPFYKLRHIDDAPQLPYGYSAMLLIAMVPPLWFRIMNRELDRFEERRAAA